MYATQELSEGVALEEDDLPDGEILTGACGGLIMVDNESQTVRAVHYTAQQYFERCYGQKLMQARLSLTKVSLAYLTLPNFSGGACTTDTSMSRRLELYPFLDYAAKHWGSDSGKLDSSLFLPSLQSFVSNSNAVEITNQVWSLRGIRYINWSQEFPRRVPALVLAAAFDLPGIIRRMVLDGHEIEDKGSDGETALIRAAAFGHAENVRTLLELGAAVNARDYMDEAALQRAARNGDESVVKVLLEGAADVNTKASSDLTALMSAVSSNNMEVVRMLVQAGADLQAETVWGDSALSIATRNGQEAIATLLADNGAILPRGPAGRRASIVAARRGFHHLARRLTADYEAVAARTLQRQSSRLMDGLSEIQEEAGPSTETAPRLNDTQTEKFGLDEGDFSEVMEGLEYSVGFAKRYDLGESIVMGHFAKVFVCTNKVTGVVYAVKSYRLSTSLGKMFLEIIRMEIRAMQECSEIAQPR